MTYTEAKKTSFSEIAVTQPLKTFLIAIKENEPKVANVHPIQLKTETNSNGIYELIEDF